jgi:hypothetical membrane protein
MELVKERGIFVGLAALLAVIVFGASWYTSALSDPAWVFGTNYLSDLGVSDVWAANVFFNMGCLLAGILFVWFGLGLFLSKASRLERIAGILAVVAGVSMSMIGIIVEGQDLHVYLAYAAFGVGFLSLIVLAISDFKTGRRLLSSFTFIGLIVGILTYVVLCTDWLALEMDCFLVDFPGVETMGALILAILFTLQGMKYLYCGALEKRSPSGKGISDRHQAAYAFALMVGATAFLLFLLFAMLSSTGWLLGDDYVYELGLISGETSMYYAIGCMVGGAFMVLYGAGEGMIRAGGARNSSGFFIAVMGILLVLMGIAFMVRGDIDFGLMEYLIIGSGVAALTCITVSDWQHKRMVTAAFYLVILVCGLAALLFFGYTAASVMFVIAFFFMLEVESMRMLTHK